MQATLKSSIPGLNPIRSGKVREIYDLGTSLLLVATDRISAFDVIMANGIPDKGRVLNQISAFWFGKLGHICPNHLISIDQKTIESAISEVTYRKHDLQDFDLQGRSMLVRKAVPLTIECVVRGYLTGSLYKEYSKHGGKVHGFDLPTGLLDGARLPEPMFTPATKAESGHDENLSEALARDRIGDESFETVKKWSLDLYRCAFKHAHNCGLILADTKFEFGVTDSGLILIDEVLTPDSSRYWPLNEYAPGEPQSSFDKQFVRNFLESIDWDKSPPGPTLPDEIVAKTREKYFEAFRMLTGSELQVGL